MPGPAPLLQRTCVLLLMALVHVVDPVASLTRHLSAPDAPDRRTCDESGLDLWERSAEDPPLSSLTSVPPP